ncbi:MAG: hypothetical protein ALAOOOJD_02592 [bacterium]|nr:hypothetical protein [bacterium]
MKYMQNGGFQSQPVMRLTLFFTLLLLLGFWLSNFALYFTQMSLTPQSVIDFYRGSEAEYRMPRTYQAMLEVTHMHLPMMAVVLLLLTHLLIFVPLTFRQKMVIIITTFISALGFEAAGWLVRFVHPLFAWLKIAGFLILQAMLALLLGTLALFLLKAAKN